ncbi:MAG: FmdB family zinc ribbon protein [Gemmatimonadaceae bacterium]
MPTYEFRCPDGHEFEKFYRKISDATTELPCPECGKLAARLVSGGAGLLFKGSGFYLTDYGKNAHRKAGPPSSSDGGKSGGEGAGSESTRGESTRGESARGDTGSSAATEPKSSDSKASDAKPAEVKSSSDTKPAKKPSSGTPKSGT